MAQELPDRDGIETYWQGREMRPYGIVQRQHSPFGEDHDRHGREGLGFRSNPKHHAGVNRNAEFQICETVPFSEDDGAVSHHDDRRAGFVRVERPGEDPVYIFHHPALLAPATHREGRSNDEPDQQTSRTAKCLNH